MQRSIFFRKIIFLLSPPLFLHFFLTLIKIFLFLLLSFIPYLSFFSHPALIIIFSSGSGHVPTFKILDLNGHVKTHFNYVWCNPNSKCVHCWGVQVLAGNTRFRAKKNIFAIKWHLGCTRHNSNGFSHVHLDLGS